jgi:hypothetical protein
MLRTCRDLLQPTVFVISLLLIDSTALQQTFTEECKAYLEEGGTLKLRLSEKNKKQRIELEEKATIVQIDAGNFGLRWEQEGEEFSDDKQLSHKNCVMKFVKKAAAKVLAAFPEKYELPGDDHKKHYTYVTYYPQGVYYPQGEKPPSLSSYISKARDAAAAAAADAAAAEGAGGGHTREYLAEGHGAGACALFSSLS